MKKNIFKVIGLVLTCILTCGLFVGCVGFDAVEDMTKDELLGKVDSIVETYKSENTKTNNEIDKLDEKLETNNAELDGIKAQVEANNTELGNIKTEINALNQTNETIGTEVDGVKGELEEINEKLAELNNLVGSQLYTKEQLLNSLITDYYVASARLMTDVKMSAKLTAVNGLTIQEGEVVYTVVYDSDNEQYYTLTESEGVDYMASNLSIIEVKVKQDESKYVENKVYTKGCTAPEILEEDILDNVSTLPTMGFTGFIGGFAAEYAESITLKVLGDGIKEYTYTNKWQTDAGRQPDENGEYTLINVNTVSFKDGLVIRVTTTSILSNNNGLPYSQYVYEQVDETFEYGLTLEDLDLTEYFANIQE